MDKVWLVTSGRVASEEVRAFVSKEHAKRFVDIINNNPFRDAPRNPLNMTFPIEVQYSTPALQARYWRQGDFHIGMQEWVFWNTGGDFLNPASPYANVAARVEVEECRNNVVYLKVSGISPDDVNDLYESKCAEIEREYKPEEEDSDEGWYPNGHGPFDPNATVVLPDEEGEPCGYVECLQCYAKAPESP